MSLTTSATVSPALARSHSGALSIGASSEAHSADIGKRGDGVAVQLADHIFLVQRQLHRAAAVGK